MSALKSLSFVLTPFKMVFHAFSLSITMMVELLRELWLFVNISTKKMMFMAGFLLKECQSSPPVCLSTFILLHGTTYSFLADLWPSLTFRSLLKEFMGISLNGMLPGPKASVLISAWLLSKNIWHGLKEAHLVHNLGDLKPWCLHQFPSSWAVVLGSREGRSPWGIGGHIWSHEADRVGWGQTQAFITVSWKMIKWELSSHSQWLRASYMTPSLKVPQHFSVFSQ